MGMDKIKLSLLHDWERENESVLDEMGIDCKKKQGWKARMLSQNKIRMVL